MLIYQNMAILFFSFLYAAINIHPPMENKDFSIIPQRSMQPLLVLMGAH
jgi:hypothetical protein